MTKKVQILNECYQFIKKYKRIPTITDFVKLKHITRHMIRHHFGNITTLIEECYAKDPKLFDSLVGPINFQTTEEKKLYVDQLRVRVKDYKKFVITAYSNGSIVNRDFYNNLKLYCRKNDALLIIMPIAGSKHNMLKLPDGSNVYWNIDDILKKESFLVEDVRLNTNLLLSSIKLNTKQINPLTGLHRLGQRNGCFVYGSPKQFLETVATSNYKIPSVLLTTGVLNSPDYLGSLYKMNRTDKLAESDHTLGALVVELVDDKYFFVRHLQGGKNNELYDLDKVYNKSVHKTSIDAIIFGDIHGDEIDQTCFTTMKEEIKLLKPKQIFLHDFFNGTSVNHHIKDKLLERTVIADNKQDSLQHEVVICAKQLKELLKTDPVIKIVIVKSNHDEFLIRYLDQGRYLTDYGNKSYAIKLVDAYLQAHGDDDPLKIAVNNCGILTDKEKSRIVWLKRDKDYIIHGIECGAHGDLGSNGTKGSPNSLERAYCNLVCGHGHTPMIMRGYWRVGVNCSLRQRYTRGPSGWAHADVIIHKNGTRQMIIKINGRWKLS